MATRADLASSHSIRTAFRCILALGGSLSWLGGAAAVFKKSNGAGAVALVIAGAFGSLVALIGRWPSKISVSGNELTWEQVSETVETQIRAVGDSDENSDVLRELQILQRRLVELQLTGVISEHPAAIYDRRVQDSINRTLPDSVVSVRPARSRAQADFSVRVERQEVLVETKWRADDTDSFRGSTLKQLSGSLGDA